MEPNITSLAEQRRTQASY